MAEGAVISLAISCPFNPKIMDLKHAVIVNVNVNLSLCLILSFVYGNCR